MERFANAAAAADIVSDAMWTDTRSTAASG